ncbi:rCG44691 [Rattus norvegicus]|uniref:RCG44691 n=1 Tax=Rattus norvegicus TaxID=10116 RepID=A6I5V0_RAT|nr:rCG44691 [Rattus norvegicus]
MPSDTNRLSSKAGFPCFSYMLSSTSSACDTIAVNSEAPLGYKKQNKRNCLHTVIH